MNQHMLVLHVPYRTSQYHLMREIQTIKQFKTTKFSESSFCCKINVGFSPSTSIEAEALLVIMKAGDWSKERELPLPLLLTALFLIQILSTS